MDNVNKTVPTYKSQANHSQTQAAPTLQWHVLSCINSTYTSALSKVLMFFCCYLFSTGNTQMELYTIAGGPVGQAVAGRDGWADARPSNGLAPKIINEARLPHPSHWLMGITEGGGALSLSLPLSLSSLERSITTTMSVPT